MTGDRVADPGTHGMVPGTHEWPRTPECRCGNAWDRWNDECVEQLATSDSTRVPEDEL